MKPWAENLASALAGVVLTLLVLAGLKGHHGPAPHPPPKPDPFAAAVQAAYDADPAPAADRAAAARAIAAALRTVDPSAPDLTTAYGLYCLARSHVAVAVPAGTLAGVSEVVARELAATLPTEPNTPLTPELRSRAASQLARVAAALEACAGP